MRRPSGAGRRGAVLIRIGLTLYDWLGRHARTLPAHRILSRPQALATMPGLTPAIIAAAEYWDGQVSHPERLNLELVLDALNESPQAEALTYTAFEGLADGAVMLRDTVGRRGAARVPAPGHQCRRRLDRPHQCATGHQHAHDRRHQGLAPGAGP